MGNLKIKGMPRLHREDIPMFQGKLIDLNMGDLTLPVARRLMRSPEVKRTHDTPSTAMGRVWG